MGADMLLAGAVLEVGKTPDFEAGRSFIKRLTKPTLCELTGEDHVEDIQDLVESETIREIRKELVDALEEFEEAVTGYHRQLATLHPRNGDTFYVSGGLSNGDSPTELFEVIEKLGTCGVLEAAGFTR